MAESKLLEETSKSNDESDILLSEAKKLREEVFLRKLFIKIIGKI